MYFPAATAARQVPRTRPLSPTAAEPTRTAALPGAITSTRTSAPGVARSANVTRAPGATEDGDAVKPLAVGPASVPPLWAEATAGRISRTGRRRAQHGSRP